MAGQLSAGMDTARNALVVGDAYAQLTLDEAVTAAGGRVAGTLEWNEVPGAVSPALLRLVALDLRTAAPGSLDAPLARMLATAREAGAHVVAALDDAQIDAFAADLLAPDVDLLVAPTPVELVGAVALALAGEDLLQLHDVSREAARLERLNQEVARIAETLARLTRRGDPLPEPGAAAYVAEHGRPSGAAPAIDAEPADANEIRQTIRARRMRDQLFGREGLFEDPAWDMLLDLFAARIEHRQVSVSSLCIAAAVAPTTALRWIGKLIDGGLLDRRPDAFDKRRAFIGLTDTAAAAMRGYVSAVKRAGLPIA